MPTTTFPPILVWQPGGGTPVGPVSNPPVYSQSDITQLVIGQAYVDVVFGSVQTDNNWVLVTCEVENTIDLAPLNIWPGIITNRTPAGFRVWLNGLPDSSNYYLHWAVSGINIVPVPATLYQFTGPTSGPFGVDAVFTVKLPPSSTSPGVVITPGDGGAGGTFSPTSVTISTGSFLATFIYTAAAYGTATISVTNDHNLTDPSPIAFTSAAPIYTLTGPSSGTVGVASTNFTVNIGGQALAMATTITPHDGGAGGTFAPTTVLLTTGSAPQHFTYTAVSAGAVPISVTNNGGLIDPSSLTYTVTLLGIAGLKLWLKADSLALSDGAAVSAWNDSSGLSNNFAQGTGANQPVYKTNIVNTKPTVRFDGSNDRLTATATLISTGTAYTIFVVASTAVGSTNAVMFASGDGTGSAAMVVQYADAWYNQHTDGASSIYAKELASVVANQWNVLTADWNLTNIHLWRNGVLKDTTGTTVLSHAGTSNSIGLDVPDGNLYPWNGDIAEILVYAAALSTPDRQAVEAYLRGKYGTP